MLPDRRDPCKDMHNDVCVVIGPHVVEAYKARHVLGPVQSPRPLDIQVESGHLNDRWIEHSEVDQYKLTQGI